MVCEFGTNIVACGPPRGVYHRALLNCPECKRRHRFVIRWDGAWCGTTDYGSCGDWWQEGFRADRPFQRGWREEARAKFRAMWDNAAPRNLYNAYVNADCRMAIAGDDDWEQAADDRAAALAAIRAHAATKGN